MGYNTTIKIINDGFDQLRRFPSQFVDSINHYMHDGGEFGLGNHANVAQVMPAAHASDFRLYGVHGNLMMDLNAYSRETRAIASRQPGLVQAYIRDARARLDELEIAIEQSS